MSLRKAERVSLLLASCSQWVGGKSSNQSKSSIRYIKLTELADLVITAVGAGEVADGPISSTMVLKAVISRADVAVVGGGS